MTDQEKIKNVAKIMRIEFGPLINQRTDEAADWVEIVDAVLCEHRNLSE